MFSKKIFRQLIIGFVRLCIEIGSFFIFLAEKLYFVLVFLLIFLQKLLSKLFGFVLHTFSSWFWLVFKKPRVKKRRWFSLNYYLLFYRIKYFILGFLIALMLVSIKWSLDFINKLPNPSLVENNRSILSTHLYDRHGKLLYEVFREQNRTPVKLKDLPEFVKWATISIEDKDFYKHKGVSIIGGILRAVKETLFRHKLQGGSTITQQLVKSALLSPERTIQRKIKEIILALLVERKYSKDQILEMYLNQVPYGGTAWGIEEASRMYFGKSASKLTLHEAALLSGLPQAPTLYSPYTNPKAAKERQLQVLSNMLEEGYIDRSTYEQARKKPLSYKRPENTILAPHFVFYVKSILEKEYGLKTVQTGGLRVYTTLDYSIQKQAEKILAEELKNLSSYNVGNGAILVTRPSTGEILSMVGSRDFFSADFGAYNVTTALRQPGSAIKPIMYTLALKKGMNAATLINDTPVSFNIPGSSPYTPVNYDGKFHGSVPLRYALANSYNIPAVKTLETIGVNNFINFAEKFGIQSWSEDKSRYGLSLTLGGGEVTVLEMATAFGTLRNLGLRQELNPILRIENSLGEVIYERGSGAVRAVGEEEPFIISDILSDNVARSWAFGANSPLNFGEGYISVKTGTTDVLKDNWTIGFTRPTLENNYADVLVAVWVGNNDGSPMNPNLTSGITGAAPIWRKTIERLVDKNFFKESLYIPDGIEKKICYFGRVEYFVKGTADKINCFGYKLTTTPTERQ